MLDPAKQAIFSQGIAAMKEFYCGGCAGLYGGFKDEGFSEEQAFRLTRDWLIAIVVKPPEDIPPEQ